MVTRGERPIAVVGATGRQGTQVVRHLLAQGWSVRALTRNPTSRKAASLGHLGAELVQANLENPASLEVAFAGAYGAYSVQQPIAGKIDVEIRHGVNVAYAAKATGVEHVVYASAGLGEKKVGIEQWDAKVEITRAMKALALPLTILRPTAFMELMVDPSFYPSIATWHVWPKLSGGEYKVSWISVRDIGAIAAQVFANPNKYLGKDLALAADVKSLNECRALYAEILDRRPPQFPMPTILFEKIVGKDLPAMWRWLRDHPVVVDTSQTYDIYPEAMNVRTWLGTLKSESAAITHK